MHTTFSLTRESLSELQGMIQAAWVQTQMELPLESHREYYRQCVLAYSSSGDDHMRAPCHKNRAGLDFFLPTRRPKDNLFGGLCQDLSRWRIVHRGRTGSWASSFLSLADFSRFVCEVEHDSWR